MEFQMLTKTRPASGSQPQTWDTNLPIVYSQPIPVLSLAT